MKNLTGVVVAITMLSGCAAWRGPTTPVLPDGEARMSVNSAAIVAEVTAEYYRQQAAINAKSAKPREDIQLALAQVVDRYIPNDYKVYVDESVDLRQAIWYDPTKNWTEALGRSLTEAGIEMTANLKSKVMVLKQGTSSITQVLDKQLPPDYMIFADKNIDLSARIKYDRSKQWSEELGRALADIGIHMIANIDKKVIVLKAKPLPEVATPTTSLSSRIHIIQ